MASPRELIQRWRASLLECLPPRLRSVIGKEKAQLRLSLGEEGLDARMERGEASESIGTLRPANVEGLRGVFTGVAAGQGLIKIVDGKPTLNRDEAALSGQWTARDLWLHKDLGGFDTKLALQVPAHGAVLLKLSPNPK